WRKIARALRIPTSTLRGVPKSDAGIEARPTASAPCWLLEDDLPPRLKAGEAGSGAPGESKGRSVGSTGGLRLPTWRRTDDGTHGLEPAGRDGARGRRDLAGRSAGRAGGAGGRAARAPRRCGPGAAGPLRCYRGAQLPPERQERPLPGGLPLLLAIGRLDRPHRAAPHPAAPRH